MLLNNTYTRSHTLTHPATNLQVEAELCLFVPSGAGCWFSPVRMLIRGPSMAAPAAPSWGWNRGVASDGGTKMRGGEGGRSEAPLRQNSQLIISGL